MGYVARLEKGTRKLNLNDSTYSLHTDFVPPSTVISAFYAEGTFLNRYGGSVKINEKAINVPWSFTVECQGSTQGQVDRAISNLTGFIAQPGTLDPLVFAFRGNNNIEKEPVYGQHGIDMRYEIVHGQTPTIGERYGIAETRSIAAPVTFDVVIRPCSYGVRQTLAEVEGGIFNDTLGVSNEKVRGVAICEATTNIHQNSYFQHSTWNTGWTAGTNIIATENQLKEFVLLGVSSAKLTAAGSTLNTFTESITLAATTHMLSYYVKLPGSDEVTSSHIAVTYNGSSQTTSYHYIGDGWYRISASVTGTGAAAAAGVEVVNRITLYMDMAQAEAKAYITMPCHGYMLGCSWSGTAHASSSSRTAGEMRLPTSQALDIGEGTIRIAFRAIIDSSDVSGTITFFEEATTGMALTFTSAGGFTFTDGTSSVTESIVLSSWSAGDEGVVYCSYGGGTTLQVASSFTGASFSSNNYTPAAFSADLYLGSSSTPDQYANVVMMDYTFWSHRATSAEIGDDLANVSSIAEAGGYLSSIPWLWTKDGDSKVDNCTEGSTYHNYAVIGGVSGDIPAITLIAGTLNTDMSQINSVWLSNLDMDEFFDPASLIFFDQSGQVVSSTCGGEVKRTTLNTTEASLMTIEAVNYADGSEYLFDREYVPFFRIVDNGSDLTVENRYALITDYVSEFQAISPGAAFRLHKAPALRTPNSRRNMLHLLKQAPAISFYLQGIRTVSGSADVDVDFVNLFFRPYCQITGGSNSDQGFAIEDGKAIGQTSTGSPGFYFNLGNTGLLHLGDKIEFVPNKINILSSLQGDTNKNPTIDNTITYTMTIIPRWRLLQ